MRKWTGLGGKDKKKSFGENVLSPTGKHIALAGLLSFFIFACLENIVCLVLVELYWPYYLVSFAIWLSLALITVALAYAIHRAIGKIFRISWVSSWLLPFVLLLPNMIYTEFQARNIRMAFQVSHLGKLAVFFLVLVAYIPAITFLRNVIRGSYERLGPEVMVLVFAWGLSSLFGTLIVGAELQGVHWKLKTIILITFHFIIPYLNAAFSRRPKSTKVRFVILNGGGWLAAFLVLSSIFVFPFMQKIAYGQARIASNLPSTLSMRTQRPNILLMVMDTARAKNMSMYGYKRPTTPHLHEFARDAVVFQNSISSSSWTLPAHATLFTGLPGYLHFASFTKNVEDPVVPLAAHFDTLAEILHATGYKTGAAVANTLFLSPKYGLNQGFEFFWWGRVRSASLLSNSLFQIMLNHFPVDSIYAVKKLCGLPDNNAAARINQISLNWLQNQAQASRPWFLFINYMDTHGTPYLSAPFSHKFSAPPRLHMPGRWQQRNPKTGLPRRLDPPFLEEARGWYDNEMAALDYEIGQLLNQLKELEIYDNTLIVITSDHGELLGEHDDFGHGNWLYQELLHVPLIVKYPRGKHGGQVHERSVQNSDVFAEILEQAGIALPPDITGQPFARTAHLVFSEVNPIPEYAMKWPARFKQNLQAVYSKDLDHYKLIRSNNEKIELYDLYADGGEENPLIDSQKTAVVLDELKKFLADLNARRQKLLKKQSFRQGELDPDTLRKMRALGYLN